MPALFCLDSCNLTCSKMANLSLTRKPFQEYLYRIKFKEVLGSNQVLGVICLRSAGCRPYFFGWN